jgi:hypothetical protein
MSGCHVLNVQMELPKLLSLDISHCAVLSNLNNLKCPDLEYLNASDSTCLDLSCLANFLKLNTLLVSHVPNNLETILSLKNLTDLDITATCDASTAIKIITSCGKNLLGLSLGDRHPLNSSLTNSV